MMTTDNGAMLDVKGRGAEVIGVDGNVKDCGTDAGSLSMAVVVDGGSNGMKPMEPIGVNEGCGKDFIAACSHQLLLQSTMAAIVAIIDDKGQLLASGGCCHQQLGSGNDGC